MAVTPLVKPIDSKTGTFYAFQSAINDSNLIGSQDNFRFTYSKYAMLRIPEIGVISSNQFDDISVPNKVQFKALGDSVLVDGLESDQVYNFSQSFQNYCLNMEAVLLSQPNYSSGSNRTVAERVFFKWLKELGSIRFRETNTSEKDNTVVSDKRFVEEDEYFDQNTGNYVGYNKVVKYVNDISAIHSNKQDIVTTELYLYTPTDHGTTPHVLFKSISDDNYSNSKSYINVSNSNNNVEYLSGRTDEDVSPFGLKTKSYYDYDGDELITYEIWNDTTDVYESGSWFIKEIGDPTINSYITDSEFNISINQRLKKTKDESNNVEYLRTTLDGITIDWNLNNYALAQSNNDSHMQTFNDFNSYINSKDFEYNAILIYYDLIDINDPTNVITNLYGVYFLNTIVTFGTEHIIQINTKYKPDIINKTNGTASAYKINLKSDSSYENVGVVKLLNTKTSGDYNTFSMDLYIEALTSMNNMAKTYANNITYITDIANQITQLRNLFIDDVNKDEIMAEINIIEQSLAQSNSLFESSNAIMEYIQDLYSKYNDILTNNTILDVRYNLSSSILNSMIEHNQEYNISINSYKIDLSSANFIPLVKYNNYIKHKNPEGINITKLDNDLYIYIDDSSIKWSYGQSFKIIFGDQFDPQNNTIYIKTDSSNKSILSTPYGVNIASLNKSNFENSDLKPIFEIICVDSDNFIFEIDQLK